MTLGPDKLAEYVAALEKRLYSGNGSLDVASASDMLVLVKCIEAALTAYLLKMKP